MMPASGAKDNKVLMDFLKGRGYTIVGSGYERKGAELLVTFDTETEIHSEAMSVVFRVTGLTDRFLTQQAASNAPVPEIQEKDTLSSLSQLFADALSVYFNGAKEGEHPVPAPENKSVSDEARLRASATF
jgi:hypothetical protein